MKDQKKTPSTDKSSDKKTPQSGFRDDDRRAGEAGKGGKPGQGKGGQPQDKGKGQTAQR